MTKLLAIVCLFLLPAIVIPQEKTPVFPEDGILNKLVGNWTASGIAHGNRYTWTMHGEWVLSHQFLRWTEKSDQNIVGVGRPFEVIYFFRYDYQRHQYSAHMLKNYGAEDSGILGYSELKTDQLAFIYKLPEETVTEQLTWQPELKTWQMKSWGDPPNGKRIDILDMKITQIEESSKYATQ